MRCRGHQHTSEPTCGVIRRGQAAPGATRVPPAIAGQRPAQGNHNRRGAHVQQERAPQMSPLQLQPPRDHPACGSERRADRRGVQIDGSRGSESPAVPPASQQVEQNTGGEKRDGEMHEHDVVPVWGGTGESGGRNISSVPRRGAGGRTIWRDIPQRHWFFKGTNTSSTCSSGRRQRAAGRTTRRRRAGVTTSFPGDRLSCSFVPCPT